MAVYKVRLKESFSKFGSRLDLQDFIDQYDPTGNGSKSAYLRTVSAMVKKYNCTRDEAKAVLADWFSWEDPDSVVKESVDKVLDQQINEDIYDSNKDQAEILIKEIEGLVRDYRSQLNKLKSRYSDLMQKGRPDKSYSLTLKRLSDLKRKLDKD